MTLTSGIFAAKDANGGARSLIGGTTCAPEKIEFVGGIFTSEEERLTVLAMLLENLGIDKAVRLGKLEDWKAAIAELE